MQLKDHFPKKWVNCCLVYFAVVRNIAILYKFSNTDLHICEATLVIIRENLFNRKHDNNDLDDGVKMQCPLSNPNVRARRVTLSSLQGME